MPQWVCGRASDFRRHIDLGVCSRRGQPDQGLGFAPQEWKLTGPGKFLLFVRIWQELRNCSVCPDGRATHPFDPSLPSTGGRLGGKGCNAVRPDADQWVPTQGVETEEAKVKFLGLGGHSVVGGAPPALKALVNPGHYAAHREMK